MPTTEIPKNPERDDRLLRAWCALLERSGGDADAEAFGRELLRRWSEPQRRYHTTAHLADMLDLLDDGDAGLAAHAEDADAVRLAVWFHDAVYRPDRSENEERSAELALRALGQAGVGDELAREVERLVLLTTAHAPEPGDRNGEALCDADLAVLARDPDGYAAYAAAVREEYAFVPDDAFREGRSAVLRELLALPRLYRTPAAQKFEAPARRNLRWELNALAAGA